MPMTEDEARDVTPDLVSMWQQERPELDRIDRWARWDHEKPAKPRKATKEYQGLVDRAQAPWGDLIVSSVAQTLYVEGYRRPSDPEDGSGWRMWQANGLDARQNAINRGALTYGYAYGAVLPGQLPDGTPMPSMRGVSPRDMMAVFRDPIMDDWPEMAVRVQKVRGGHLIELWGDTEVWSWRVESIGQPLESPTVFEHGAGVCPIVRFRNREDLEGRLVGEVEPFIPLLGKVDQTSFDRLVVQRFASWIVRTIAGMDVPESAKAAGTDTETLKLKLSVEDFLTSPDPDTRFGSLPASDLSGFISAHEADLQTLAAVSQTPAYELLGSMVNMSAEALAAARASLTAKSDERKKTLGEGYEQMIRLAAHVSGDEATASDFEAEVRWADTTIRSLSQAVDAYGKVVQQLGIPAQTLWPKIPGFTQQDVDEAKRLAEQGGPMEALLRELQTGQTSAGGDGGVDG